jgi:hypothetical protein
MPHDVNVPPGDGAGPTLDDARQAAAVAISAKLGRRVEVAFHGTKAGVVAAIGAQEFVRLDEIGDDWLARFGALVLSLAPAPPERDLDEERRQQRRLMEVMPGGPPFESREIALLEWQALRPRRSNPAGGRRSSRPARRVRRRSSSRAGPPRSTADDPSPSDVASRRWGATPA